MIASPVSGLRWMAVLLIGATVSIAVCRAWPAVARSFARAFDRAFDRAAVAALAGERADERPATYRYVPLRGLPLDYAVDDVDGDWDEPLLEAPPGPVQTCLPFLAPILAHPNWKLRIASGYPSCGGPIEPMWEFTIASSGAVTWMDRRGQVRHLSLSEAQLALVRRLDQLSCVELQRNEYELQYGSERRWLAIGLDLGKYEPGDGAYVPAASNLGRAIIPMLDELVDRYRGQRQAVIGSMDLRLATTERGRGAAYRVRLVGDRLTVRRGGSLLLDQPMADELRLDLVDAALEQRAVDKPSMKGALYMDGWSVPVQLVRTGTGSFEEIYRAIDTAQETESWLRANGMRSITE
jgi:hypothetical protein